ncbi:50S ribosomal protein L32 [Candidatus Parcubacteria bacterium]|nr:50S ribosomal protein L32 [Candidatus Parcubacteria bacterium]
MPVPARRRSESAGKRRRAHNALKPQVTGVCKSCNAPKLPHRACASCGTYKG